MGWAIGYDSKWDRDIGYGVPAYCDYPGCREEINRGLAYVCGEEPYGGDRGCGLFFCHKHLQMPLSSQLPGQLCDRCYPRIKKPFKPSPEHPDWIEWKLTDQSWEQWRKDNPQKVEELQKQCASQ